MAEQGFFTICDEGIRLKVRLTPKADRDEIGALERMGEESWLKLRVRAVPENGKANKAAEKLIAGVFGVAKSAVVVETGQTSRRKTLIIRGEGERLACICDQLARVEP